MISRKFSVGQLSLDIEEAALPIDSLFDFAERNNPKRAFLFVSKVLGRHIPAAPSAMRRIWQMLAAGIQTDPQVPALFVGMAETALALGAGVFRECRPERGLFLADTRHDFARPLLAGFEERHSHATKHLLYRPADFGERTVDVFAVDDELTTGSTLENMRAALTAAGLRLRRFVPVAIMDWRENKTGTSLVRGSWQWRWTDSPCPLPPGGRWQASPIAISSRQDWGRFGAASLDLVPWPEISAPAQSRVLVLGTGEFVWPPFLLAERLERAGALVRFGATTRSPIRQGMAIKSKLEFADNYGEGIANYLYNVNPDDYDQIFICCETGASSISPILLDALKKAVALEY